MPDDTNPIDPYSGARMVPGHFFTTPIEEAREAAYQAGRAAMHARILDMLSKSSWAYTAPELLLEKIRMKVAAMDPEIGGAK
jgi:hypothetical protein